MTVNNLISFLKKKGFRDTFKVLTEFEDYKTDKHTFYNELNKFSYYNSYFRVKDDLVKKGLIKIEKIIRKSILNSRKKVL